MFRFGVVWLLAWLIMTYRFGPLMNIPFIILPNLVFFVILLIISWLNLGLIREFSRTQEANQIDQSGILRFIGQFRQSKHLLPYLRIVSLLGLSLSVWMFVYFLKLG